MKFTNYYNFNPHTYSDGILYASSPRLHSVLTIDDLVQKDYVFECEMSNGDYGSHHFGPMIYNKEENYWLFFGYDYDNHSIGVYELKNKNPRNTEKEFISLRHKNLDPSFNINSFHRFKIEVNLQQAFFYLDDILIFEFPFPFFEYYFSFCCYFASFVAKNITIMPIVKEKSFSFWRVSNIKNRRSNQTYRSVGNLLFKAKTGELSNDPIKGISESSYSKETLPGNAFDGLDNTFSTSSSLEDGTNTEQHGSSWWIGYEFPYAVQLESLDVSMRYDMADVSYDYGGDSLGQEWVSFLIDGSHDGIEWFSIYKVSNAKIFKNDISKHSYSLPKNNIVLAKFWKLGNMSVASSAGAWRSLSELHFNSFDKQPFNDLSKLTVSGNGDGNGNNDQSDKSYLIDKNRLTRWTNMNADAFISYEFSSPTYLESINLQPRNDLSYGQELQTADIFYSYDNINWTKYGSIAPKIPYNDMSLVENIPIELVTSSEFQYVSKISETNKYKFWRCKNIISTPHSLGVQYNVTVGILDFINVEGITLDNKFNSFQQNSDPSESENGPQSAFDGTTNTFTHTLKNTDNLVNYENYYIGCMFQEPVEVTDVGIQSRFDLIPEWGQTWQTCNVEYSDNGFDWITKGYCEFNVPRGDKSYHSKPIISLETLDKHRFWRIPRVYARNVGRTDHFCGWEIRFNTLTGEKSNNPNKGFSNGSWDSFWTPNRAFDGNVSTSAGGFHPKQNPTEPYTIGYEFDTPQYVGSISVLMRRDTRNINEDWMFCLVEYSDDGIEWFHKGYCEFNCIENTRFYLAKIEDESPIDRLRFSSYFSLKNIELNNYEYSEFNSKYLDPKITNLNIYNPNSNGVVKGQVLELNDPVVREVAIYDRRTRQLIAITWSNEEGFYEFKNLNSSKTYYVHAIDSNKIYNAVTKDMLEPLK